MPIVGHPASNTTCTTIPRGLLLRWLYAVFGITELTRELGAKRGLSDPTLYVPTTQAVPITELPLS